MFGINKKQSKKSSEFQEWVEGNKPEKNKMFYMVLDDDVIETAIITDKNFIKVFGEGRHHHHHKVLYWIYPEDLNIVYDDD